MHQNNGKLDLNDLAKRHNLKLEVAPAEESGDAKLRRWKDAVLFSVAVLLVLVISGICFWIVIAQGVSGDDKKWATSVLTLITGGIIGYLTGKAAK